MGNEHEGPCDHVRSLTAEAATIMYDAYDLLQDVEDLRDKMDELVAEARTDYVWAWWWDMDEARAVYLEVEDASVELVGTECLVNFAGEYATDAFGVLDDELCECLATKGADEYPRVDDYEYPLERARECLEEAQKEYDAAKAAYPGLEALVSELLEEGEEPEDQDDEDVTLMA